MSSLTITPQGSLRGIVKVPGDKSITHRALILSALAEGPSTITGYCKGQDCLNTLRCLQDLGISIQELPDSLKIFGKGLSGLAEPSHPLDCGNSGTGIRLLAGALAGQDFFSVLTGDASLCSRPMGRIVTPLRSMGANICGRKGGDLAPLAITGETIKGIEYSSPVSSAQVKSAVLLAGLFANGRTTFVEPLPSRDHTERMFRYLGIPLVVTGRSVQLTGRIPFKARDLSLPGDISAAAFFLVGASIVPNSEVQIPKVGLNPERTGILEILKKMGANIEVLNLREETGEPVGDLLVRSASLHGTSIGVEQIPKTIDELPIFCVAAAMAKGDTTVAGAQELRVKETDRIHAMVTELRKMNVSIQETADGFIIRGGAKIKGASCASYGDHRVAMAVAIAGLVANSPTIIENTTCIDTSFPGFYDKLLELLTFSK